MTHRTAFYLALVLTSAILLDLVFTGGSTIIFLADKFWDLIRWVSFWR